MAVLILSRFVGEQIVIGDNQVVIEIVEIQSGGRNGYGKPKVRIGLRAAKDIPIHRKEVFDSIKTNQKDGKTVSLQKETREELEARKNKQQGVDPDTVFSNKKD